jgi:anti-anti-sigma factor
MVHIATDTSTKPRAVGLYVRGQLDLTAVGAFRESLTRATRTSRAVEVHLGNVDFIDGCGLAMLIDAMTRARGAGHEISIVDASGCVRRLIEITDTADRLAPLPGEAVAERARSCDGEELTRMASEAPPSPAFRA